MNKITVIALDTYENFSVLNSTIHQKWAWKNSSTLGAGTLNYSPTDVFENFPFPLLEPEGKGKLHSVGKSYCRLRKSLLDDGNMGLTKCYNQFHNQKLVEYVEDLLPKEFQKRFGKETWNLYNHLEIKQEGEIGFKEAVPRIFELRKLHKEMDEAVLEAYGWSDVNLRHDFYEVDYLPENDNVRYTIHPDARKEILKRLLLLNHKRFEEEVAKGLHKKKDVEAYYQQKGKPIPDGTTFSDVKTNYKVHKKKDAGKVEEEAEKYGKQGKIEL
jgi:hypothetical protein